MHMASLLGFTVLDPFRPPLLPEPIFIDAHLIPDGSDPNDSKLYFFFRERLTDNSGNTKNIHTMVARVCPVRLFPLVSMRIKWF